MNFLLKCKHLSTGILTKPSKNVFTSGLSKNNFRKNSSFIKSKSFGEIKYLKEDKIPEGYRIIYRAPMELYIKGIKNITTLTSLLIGGIILYKFTTDEYFLRQPFSDETYTLEGLVTRDSDIIWFFTGFLFFTISTRLMISRYPLRIYKNDAKYLAIYDSQLPFQKVKKEFAQGEVKLKHNNRFNPWKEATYSIKGKGVILFADYFKSPSELSNMIIKPHRNQ